MRAVLTTPLLLVFTMALAQGDEQKPTGLPGDNFDLQGALEMFKDAHDLEEFENTVNDPDHHVNNLDLNEDGGVDYVLVIEKVEGDVHAIVLQALLGESDAQDVAVIELEKTGPTNVLLQIVGDEDLYGKSVIMEPFEEHEEPEKTGPAPVDDVIRTTVNVWSWPCVSWFYGPRYSVRLSPWRWQYYPGGWKPWPPHPWQVYHGFVAYYHEGYQLAPRCRVNRAHALYGPHRVHSPAVHERYHGKGARSRRSAAASERARSIQPSTGR